MAREVYTSVRGRIVFRSTIALVDGANKGCLPGLWIDFQFLHGTSQKAEELLEGAFGLQHSFPEAVDTRALVWRQ